MMTNDLPPPRNWPTWLHYAIATMDTRSLFLENISGEHWPGRDVQRDEMEAAASAELERLQAAHSVERSELR